jgi:general secretion pathway protein F
MQFTVKLFDASRSTVIEELMDAASETELRHQCLANGRVVIAVRKAAHSRPVKIRTAAFDVGWWCRELRTLVGAGMTVVEALESLQVHATGGLRAKVHATLLRSLHEGQSLSRAMRATGAFPEVLIASVTASERTSTLVPALDDFLRYHDMMRTMRRKALSAAIYPAVVITLGLLISLFLLLYVVPRFSRMYGNFHGTLSPATQVLLWLSHLINEQMPWLIGFGGLIGVACAWAWRLGKPQAVFARVMAQITPLQRQLDHFRLAKLYQSLALMFKGGYTLDEALQVCAGLDIGPGIASGVDIARREMARGRAVSAAFSLANLTEPVSQRLLAVGERTGNFDAVLQTIADRHAESFSIFVDRATRIIEPLLLLVVALVVGGIVVMMYMPIFDIASGIR